MSHLSQLDLDAHVLRALPPELAAHAEAHLAACAACAAALASLQAAHRRFDTDVLRRTLPGVRARGEARSVRSWRWLLAPAALVAVASVAALVFRGPSGVEPSDAYGLKGGAVLRVHAKRGARVDVVADGVRLSAGDALRFTVVSSSGLPYVLIVSLDGTGAVSVYSPAQGTLSAELPQRGRSADPVELPGAIVLDAAPGPERIWALFSRAPLALSDVEPSLRALHAQGPEAVRASRQVSIPGVEAQDSFLLEKSPP
ncbi:hypothetical protein DRW03_24950 [Corallococcus sp. H22C18031201]|nr:hypothetical protein DRW03_24950 [Corallococcus sp. H22C18031201]